MSSRPARLLCLALLLGALRPALAQNDPLAWLDERLNYQSPGGLVAADFSGRLDLEGYVFDGQPPALLFERDDFFNPRLSLFADLQVGRQFYVFVQARQDRGFDPGAQVNDFRFDEYFLRWSPELKRPVSFQFGKFATIFGNWQRRHFTWDNPFINAPLPYENVTAISDRAAPGSPAALLGRQGVADNKAGWLPVIWGPAYTAGGAVFGAIEKFSYAASIKNNSISSRPTQWDPANQGWQHPTWTTRLGYTPNAAWDFGGSFSYGAYLLDGAERAATFPGPPYSRGSFNQMTLGWDLSYAHHHWEFWSEVILSRFQVPNVGNADSLSYYFETRYKLSPRIFLGLRWNQQLFDTVPDGAGGDRHWDRNIWRIDTSLGCRFTRHLQAKLQHSLIQEQNNSRQAEHLLATQLTLKF